MRKCECDKKKHNKMFPFSYTTVFLLESNTPPLNPNEKQQHNRIEEINRKCERQ